MNIVCLIGRMTKDPEMRFTPSGVAVTSFTIAVDRRFKSASGEKQTDFFDCVAWRQSAEFAANYLSKGRLVSVEGKLQQRSWVQTDGQKRSKVEVLVESVQGLDKGKGDNQAPVVNNDAPAAEDDFMDDPFE